MGTFLADWMQIIMKMEIGFARNERDDMGLFHHFSKYFYYLSSDIDDY